MGFGRKWRRESPAIKGNIIFILQLLYRLPFHYVPNGLPSDSG
jgi:hypothetical protein